MNLNQNQVIAITVAVLSVLVGSTAQLTDLFGPSATKTIASAASLMSSVLASVLAVMTGQGAIVKSVLAMPGAEKLTVNANANQTLAQLAMDPSVNNIAPAKGAEAAVQSTAAAA